MAQTSEIGADGSGWLGRPDGFAWTTGGVVAFDASALVNPWDTPDLLSALYMPNKYGGGERMWAWEGMGFRLNTGYGTEPFLITGAGALTANEFKCTEWGGPYVDFNGSTHAMTIFDDGAEDSWQEPEAYTFLLWSWVKADAFGASSRSIISKWETSGKLAYNLYWETVTGKLTFAVSSNGTTVTGVESSISESTGVWYFVGGFFNPSTLLRIYVGAADSDLVIDSNTTSIPASIKSSDSKFHVGMDGGGHWWDGGIGINAACRGLPAGTVNSYVQLLFEKTRQFYGG